MHNMRHVANSLELAVFISVLGVSFTTTVPSIRVCEKTGDHPFLDPDKCSGFFQCLKTFNGWALLYFTCPKGGVFDNISKSCIQGSCKFLTSQYGVKRKISTDESVSSLKSLTRIVRRISPDTRHPSSTRISSDIVSMQHLHRQRSMLSFPVPTTTENQTPIPTLTSDESTLPPPTTALTQDPAFDRLSSKTSLIPVYCSFEGFIRNPNDCEVYHVCKQIGGKFYKFDFRCPEGMYFHRTERICAFGTCPY